MIVGSLPAPFGSRAGVVLMGIGVTEVALAGSVLSGWAARLAASAQTLLLLVMNGGGLIWGRASIADPAAAVVNNLVLLTLAWIIAGEPS